MEDYVSLDEKNHVLVGKESKKVVELDPEDFKPLPAPYDNPDNIPPFAPYNEKYEEEFETSLDNTIANYVSLESPFVVLDEARNA